MSDELLPYYNRELEFFRKSSERFAQRHPKIAGRLGLGQGITEDPHVARLIEAFAYLNARTRHKLEDDFPELTEALLGILQPHYLAPTPSAAIVEFVLDRSQAQLTQGYNIASRTRVETDAVRLEDTDGDSDTCKFRTCYPVTLWPLELKRVAIQGQPFRAPKTQFSADTAAVLRMELQCYGNEVKFSDFSGLCLRFFINAQAPFNYALYELLMNDVVSDSGALGVAVVNGDQDADFRLLQPDQLRPVGLDRDEGLLDYSPRSFIGYRLLAEFFTFPQKLLFFDVQLEPQALSHVGNRLFLYFLLKREVPELERIVGTGTFRLGCTPIINLFEKRAQPIPLTHRQNSYQVFPDRRRPLTHEIYSVDRVIATDSRGEEIEYQPFYSFKHGRDARAQRTFWHATRRPAQESMDSEHVDAGSEVLLSFVDLDFDASLASDAVVDVELTCLNRDLPSRLPFGGGQPVLQLLSGAPLFKARCLTAPTATLRPAMRHGTMWRVISHLSLNYLSLVEYDDESGADALREILKLYDFMDSADTRTMIEGILGVATKRVVGRVGGPVSAGMCRGTEVHVHLDEEKFTGGNGFLLATVLDRFFGLYSSINSFTRTVVTTTRRDGVLRRWKPRAGERVLL